MQESAMQRATTSSTPPALAISFAAALVNSTAARCV
jgi:hypothetical protein